MLDCSRMGRLFFAATVVFGSVSATVPVWGQVINEDIKFSASDAAGGDRFGGSIAVRDGVIAIGAQYNDDNGTNSGSAYLFNAATGGQMAKLLPNDGAADDWFGVSVAIGTGIVAVGNFWDDDNGTNSGSAYLFNVTTGMQVAKLLPSDGETGDQFGSSIAIDSGVVAVGSPLDHQSNSGSAYLFNATTGAQILKLAPISPINGVQFGLSIAIDSGVVVVGGKGTAYLFDASTGDQIAQLLPNDNWAGSAFGWSVAIDGGVVAVGARYDDDNGTASGSAYLFDSSTGTQIAKLLPNDGDAEDQFGFSVAVDNGAVIVGSRYDGDNSNNAGNWGSAYVFRVATGEQIAKLLASDSASGDWFGWSVAMDNGIVVVGASGDDDNGGASGSAYVFGDIGVNTCLADFTNDGVLDIFDVFAFLDAFNALDSAADITGDGVVDIFDVFAFLDSFNAGCS